MVKVLSNRFFLLALVLMVAFSMGAVVACGGDDDDDDDDDSGDDDIFDDDDDDTDDDDDDTDDDTDDDDTDDDADDDDDAGAPVLSNGAWDPATVGVDNLSTLVWEVCDEEDNLSGGQIFVWQAGTTDNFLSGDVFWDDFTSGAPSAPDCGAPVAVGVGVDFTGAPSGTYCADLEATDGDGNLSNTLTNLCVTMP